MKIFRIFENSALELFKTIELPPETSHRIQSVLRLKLSDPLFLFNGDGYEYKATLCELKRHCVRAHITEKVKVNRQSPLSIHLGQSISKGDKMDFVIQKATELGVQRITPLFTQRSVVQLKDDRLEKKSQHWSKIALHASEQCGRVEIPPIEAPSLLDAWLQNRTEETLLVLDPNATQAIQDLTLGTSVALLIGPEGGLSSEEVAKAQQQGFTPIKLGPRILRTETATLAVLAILQAMAGDLS